MAEISKQYQKKTDKEHILDNPDTYIGSIENVEQKMYIYESEKSFKKLIWSNIIQDYSNYLMKVL